MGFNNNNSMRFKYTLYSVIRPPSSFPDLAKEGGGGFPFLGFCPMPSVKIEIIFSKKGGEWEAPFEVLL